jgi:aspartyl-tRNA(Asn)/glutamyl-tRNA(Gln) amidotransferase subunit B
MDINDAYETVVGLEVHAQLLTKSKLFSGDSASFGADPNTNVSPVTLAHPGTLPKMNGEAIGFAIKMGLACHCAIKKENHFARKNYFYPDLPKGYQISQHTTPICEGGFISINIKGGEKQIRLNRIHMEEDAGKSLHDTDPDNTSIDFNRAGIPLVEIVSEPDIRSGEEAVAYLSELRKLVRYLGICDGNMEEGSFRCDANISVRKKGERLGTRVEVKNLNSIRHVRKAIENEAAEMIRSLEEGQQIKQQTKSFNASTETSFAIRDKEDADDYRYFPDPDLAPVSLTDSFIEKIRKTIPALQPERAARYMSEYKLSEYDSLVLTEDREFSDYFQEIILQTKNYKAAANWMLGPVRSWLNENNKEIISFPLAPLQIASLVNLIDEGRINFSIASTRLLQSLLQQPGANAAELALEKNLIQNSDAANIEMLADQVLQKLPSKVEEYRKGKKGLMALFVGEVMKLSKGTADPRITNEVLSKKLKL